MSSSLKIEHVQFSNHVRYLSRNSSTGDTVDKTTQATQLTILSLLKSSSKSVCEMTGVIVKTSKSKLGSSANPPADLLRRLDSSPLSLSSTSKEESLAKLKQDHLDLDGSLWTEDDLQFDLEIPGRTPRSNEPNLAFEREVSKCLGETP